MYFDAKQIYNRVDKMRLERGWSIYRLAEMANVSVNSIYSWRDRHSSPSLYMIESIANAFRINPINILIGTEDVSILDAEQKELITYWNLLSNEQRASMMKMLQVFMKQEI